ncbi:putative hydrolase of HD superfamily [Alteromonadaceae bacterium 2753L.S.0a.02]|nr:putative hydrolase of HD superfamily [Alteromonadaceae bacterium 2753L.S.0a.02]
MSAHNDYEQLNEYFNELDRLKLVERKSYVGGGVRRENSAEHSWQLAMASWQLARYFKLDIDEEKLIKLALVHDLGEIDAGDTFLYSEQREDAHRKERECVARLAAHSGNCVAELSQLWEEQETGSSLETRLLKVADRILPLLLNVYSEGRAWREMGVKADQVRNAHAFIAEDFPELHRWIAAKIDIAVAQGWLAED